MIRKVIIQVLDKTATVVTIENRGNPLTLPLSSFRNPQELVAGEDSVNLCKLSFPEIFATWGELESNRNELQEISVESNQVLPRWGELEELQEFAVAVLSF